MYAATEGLWYLITSKNPDTSKFTDEDFDNYKDILINTNTMRTNNDPDNPKPKSSRSNKWNNIVKPVWEELKGKKSGKKKAVQSNLMYQYVEKEPEVVTISEDPSVNIERLNLLRAQYKAGNTGVRNEAITVLDALFN